MIFYNPFFPPYAKFPKPNYNPSSINTPKNNSDNTPKLPEKTQKNNCKQSHNLEIIYNILQETDTLIILALLYFLYTQDIKDTPLMLCLLLLLFD